MSEASPITEVAIIGGGIMGSGIAEICARAGLSTLLVEIDEGALERARGRISASLDRAVARGKVDAGEASETIERLAFGRDLAEAADHEIVIEAIVEDRDAKLDVFRRLAEVFAESETILATNTSSIPIVELAAAAGPAAPRVIGIHFFNPVPVMTLVELIPSLLTASETLDRAAAFVAGQLGKHAVTAPDRAGFTVNALLVPYLLAAIRMFEQGLASAEDIDVGMVRGCGHPMGPLALADMIGLDTVLGVAETLYNEHREQLFAPPPLLQRLVSAGLLGRKSGRGLYSYAQ
jgi:3-hydroxybutyryl-CoA dehydrogenase